jgi:glutamate--cysteine ligase
VLGASGGDPADDWVSYALKAPVMLVQGSKTVPTTIPMTEVVQFADWADGRALLGGRRPTVADLDYHLTTLFPPVRPRGFLEIRYLDSTPDDVWPAVVFTLATLLDDPAAVEVATEATESVATEWDLAARVGLGDERLQAAALRCVQIVVELAPPELRDAMQRLLRQVELGRSSADEFSDLVAGSGVPAAVSRLAGMTA